MSRRDLIKHLREFDCRLLREGANHSIFINDVGGQTAPVPRHNEIAIGTARKICDALEVPRPRTN